MGFFKVLVGLLALTSSCSACAPPNAISWQGGDLVPAGESYILDAPYYKSTTGITVQGGLYISDAFDVTVDVPFIDVVGEGHLEVGCEECPRTNAFELRLSSTSRPDPPPPNFKALRVIENATVLMVGTRGTRGDSWVRLARTARAGDTTLVLDRKAPTWKAGDEIIVASTDFSPNQNERAIVLDVQGVTLTISTPLNFTHYGEVSHGVDERAEVALLTRDITIRDGDANASDWGMHTIVSSRVPDGAKFHGVRFQRGGQPKIGRYPVHFHMRNQAGGVLSASAIDSSSFRGVTIHGTSNAVVRDNVVFGVMGHGYFFEDGSEVNCTLTGNLGLGISEVTRAGEKVGSEVDEAHVSIFWLENPDNTLVGNVASASRGTGYWYNTRLRARGLSALDPTIPAVNPSATPLKAFVNNTAHGVRSCMQITPALTDNLDVPTVVPSAPFANWAPKDRFGNRVRAVYDGLLCHHVRVQGMWARLTSLNLTRCVFAEAPESFQFASNGQHPSDEATHVHGCLIVGRTANLGDARLSDDYQQPRLGPYGSNVACPKSSACCGSILRIYDGPHAMYDVTFDSIPRYDCGSRVPLAAIMPRTFNVFQMSTGTAMTRTTFSNDTLNRMWIADVSGDGGKHTSVYDADGSISGIPQSTLLPSWGYYNHRRTCQPVPGNVVACPQQYANLQVNAPGSTALAVTRLTDDSGDSFLQRTLNLTTPSTPMFITAASPGAAYSILPLPFRTQEIRVQMVTMQQGAKARFALCLPPGAVVTGAWRGTSKSAVTVNSTVLEPMYPASSALEAWSSPGTMYYADATVTPNVAYFGVVQRAATQVDRSGRGGCPAVGGCDRVHVMIAPGFSTAPYGCDLGTFSTADDQAWLGATPGLFSLR